MSLFCKAYIDTMHMPSSHGHKYIVQACCSLTGWPEWQALTCETGQTLGAFIFKEILLETTHHMIRDALVKTCNGDIQKWVLAVHYTSIRDFKKQHVNQIRDYNFTPGTLVLILNKRIEPNVGRKCCPQYFGPMVVTKQLHSRAYILAEVNRAVSKLKFAAFRLISYHSRS
ncbi:hypothetical protein AN958_01388 [Leucoagaricus sp. SymC.cos]|nr:hypothetical protein AN958_01388 [Leucoagaricus sp. SymC.cos]